MSRLHGALLIVGATLCWSTSGLFVRSVEADAWTIVFWRSVSLAVVLAGYVVARHGRDTLSRFSAMGWAGLLSALLVAGSFIFFILAISLTLIANALVIMSASPLIAALCGWLVLGERVKPATIAAIAAAVCGIAVMVGGGMSRADGTLLGSLCAFGVAVTFGINIVVMRAARHVDLLPAMSLAGLFAALAALAVGAPAAIPPAEVGILLAMGCIQMSLGFFLFVRGTPHLSAAEVGLLTLCEVVLAPIWVWLAFAETPGVATLVGGVIVIGALAAHSALGIRRSKPPVGMA